MSDTHLQSFQEVEQFQCKDAYAFPPLKTELETSIGHHSSKNCVESAKVQKNYHNSNLSTNENKEESENYVDPVLATLVNSLMDQVEVTTTPTKTLKDRETKLQKNANPFLMKNSLNNSLVSTSASEDCNSCERSSSDLSCKGGRSDSLTDFQSLQRRDSNLSNEITKPLFKIPEQSPSALIEWMMQAAIISENKFTYKPEITSEQANANLNIKKPVPNKYKTEICRNWEIEGFCRFGDECTFAHGNQELNKKVSMPSNYKTKVCKQFTEAPFYCPYGEKCQFIHIAVSQNECSVSRQINYSEILNETCKQMEQRLAHLNNLEEFEIPTSVFKKNRLAVFIELTDNCTEEDTPEIQPNSPPAQLVKKPRLNKTSKEFIMPKKKAQGSSPIASLKSKEARS